VGLLGENRKLFCSLIYVDRVLFNKISFMKTISVLVLLQRNVYVRRQKIYAFSFENTKMLTCYHTCKHIPELPKMVGSTREDKMFLSLCNVECIYF
jgi:hypothetical protein